MVEFKVTAKSPPIHDGWLEAKLPKTVMMRLQSYIETAKKNSINWNSHLAGNITKSLILKDKDNWFFQTTLTLLINKFMEFYPLYTKGFGMLTENAPYCLDIFWVNFQKENEFNPFHNHRGVFSFVIWVKIPTDWKEQHALPFSANSNNPCASDFGFNYTTMMGDMTEYNYFLDKESEGTMLLFPAKLMHSVHPFYNCDKERISISGNISFDISENVMKQFRSQQKEKNDQN